jgi:hypothetical protein
MIVMGFVVAENRHFTPALCIFREMSQTRLPRMMAVCYSSPPGEKDAPNQRVAEGSSGSALTACCKKEVDEIAETLHTLPSVLLTNTPLCRQVASCTEQVL